MYLPQHNIATLDYVHDIEIVNYVHKELSSTVECILSNTVSEIKCSSNDSDVIQPALILANHFQYF